MLSKARKMVNDTRPRAAKRSPWPMVDVLQAPKTAEGIFVKFGLMSTVRGVPRIFKARNKFLSIFWALIVLNFLAISFFQVYQIINGYLNYGIKQEHNIKLSRRGTFPDITVCSLQPFRSRKSLSKDKVKKASSLINEYFFNVSERIANLSYADYLTTELQFYQGGQPYWSRENDLYYAEEDEDYGLGLDWWRDAESGDDDGDQKATSSGWEERGRRRRAPKIKIQKHKAHLVDDETMRNILMTTTGLYQNIPRNIRRKLGHQKSMIDQCVYTVQTIREKRLETANCSIRYFYFPQYFNCFTLSLDRSRGIVVELVVKLFLDDDVSLMYPKHYNRDTDSQKHGVRVVIHETDSYPDIHHDGHDVPPGMSANFIIRTNRRKHLAPPYGTCSEKTGRITNMLGSSYKYRKKTCEDQYVQQKINTKCHCIDPSLITDPVTSKNKSRSNGRLPYCMDIRFPKNTISSRLACMFDFNMNPPGLHKQCPSRCKHYEYMPTSDMAKWPHESFHLPLYQTTQATRNVSFAHLDKIINRLKPVGLEDEDTSEEKEQIDIEDHEKMADWLLKTHIFQRNFVSLTVSKPTFEVNYIEDQPDIDAPTLMSRIGGIMSFWLGITFITIMEFVEVIYDSVSLMLRNRRLKYKRNGEGTVTNGHHFETGNLTTENAKVSL